MNKEWKFAQCFGDKGDLSDITDIISTVEFDHTGNYLATGDKGGRVVLFERNEQKKSSVTANSVGAVEYKFYTEFQSHEPEFDYLKSLEIEEKINQIRWMKRPNNSHFLLSTNDKTIKLWKVFEKSINVVSEYSNPTGIEMNFPVFTNKETATAALPRKVFSNAHAYHINSISMNSDLETFISADDLRVNLWNLNYEERSFNIVDIKPANMEELTEVITAAQFHPTHCHQLIYASSKGSIKLCDLRANALCDNHALMFEEDEDPAQRSFFSEIISSISDIKFSSDGQHILSRDYLSIKLWDIKNTKTPIQTYLVHEHLKSKLCDLYENDCIFDKFEALFNGSSTKTLVGSYSNYLGVLDLSPSGDTQDVLLKADKLAFKEKKKGVNIIRTSVDNNVEGNKSSVIKLDDPTGNSNIDFNKKILHASYHPTEDVIAVAATNNLFIFANQ